MGESICSEKWLPVVGYEGIYEVSDLGRIRSLPRIIVRSNGAKQTIRGKILSPTIMNAGYPMVRLSNGDRGKNGVRLVHRLVALAFLGEPEPNQEVCHADGDRMNPRLDNLRWGTRAENMADAVAHGTQRNQNTGITHCKRGHEFTVANTYYAPSGRGNRACRQCSRERHAQKRAA